jgi:hypothetical protein
MLMILQRQTETPLSTQGEIVSDGAFMAWSLERPGPQFESDYHRIPAGTYDITMYSSPHFGRMIPLLMNVPGRSNIEIHYANYPGDLKGCIGVGMQQGKDAIYNSRMKFDEIEPIIEQACKTEGCSIEIRDIVP